MSRYIDANKLKKSLSIPCASIIEIGETIIAQIDDQPTADVVPTDFHDRCMEIEIQKRMNMVEVVRCKDCKYHAEFSSKCNKLNLTPMWLNDYCSYGEREK